MYYVGIIVKSYVCHVSTNENKESEENYIHLVLADNLDTERRSNDIRLGILSTTMYNIYIYIYII